MSEQFCLRWNNHQSTLISVFETLLESGSLIDCTLCAEGQLLKAHKVVLSACSPIFESMLCIQEDKHPIIFLKDVKFIELKAMLDYMYKGEVNILQDQLDSFLRTAAALQIKGLTDQGGGGGDEPPAKKGPGRKTGMSDVAPESPLVGNAPLREGSVSPTRRRRRLPRRPSSAEDASADNSCDIPPPAVAPPAITPATQAPLPAAEPLHRQSLTVKAKQEPVDAPLVTPKQEFVEETNEEIEDLTLDDDDDYNDSMSEMSKPGTSFGAMNPGSTSQQDFSQWQQMMGTADRSGTDEVFMAAQEAINNQTNTQDPDSRMRCEPCKIRFLEVPWFLGHLVRCPKWKENSSDVIDYFSVLSKKKLVILRGPKNKKTSSAPKVTNPANSSKRSPPPNNYSLLHCTPPATCFTCFCGKSFMSQTRHSAHVQDCLAKVMSKTKNPPVTTPATPTTAKHTEVQLDQDHFKVIIQGSESRQVTQEEVSFHIGGEGQEDDVTKDAANEVSEDSLEQEGTREAEDPLEPSSLHTVKKEHLEDIGVVENVILPAHSASADAAMENLPHSADSVTIGHEESTEVIMEAETLANPELNETVLRLEYFEEKSKQDGSQQVDVANEIEVGTYEDVAQEFVVNYEEQEEKVGKELIRGRLPSIRPLDKTLDIESTECDCGKELRHTDDITAHLEVCSVYSNQTQKTPSPRKTVVLITCVCTGKFSKTDIKEHLLHCATWKYVKHKKNLEGGRIHANEPQSDEGNVVCETVQEMPLMETETGDLTDEEERRGVSGSEGNECDDASQYITEEIIDAPSTKEDASAVAGVNDDCSTFRVNTEKPKVTYKCECGALFRHMNVFKVHQTSCSKHLRYQGQANELPLTTKPKVTKEDLLLKYSAPTPGEVLVNRQCQCGLVIDSIRAYRNHTANCLLSQAARKKNKSQMEVIAKKPPLLTLSQKRTSNFKQGSDEASESADDSTSGLKKSKVELRDELKDFVRLPDKETLRTRKRK